MANLQVVVDGDVLVSGDLNPNAWQQAEPTRFVQVMQNPTTPAPWRNYVMPAIMRAGANRADVTVEVTTTDTGRIITITEADRNAQ
ncbi:hypothetical protein PBI_QUEENHAZEL_69 [Mycobacterium phage QueenHazel]|uniref:Uncharacterized protein n=1 Tax=Mycobacterium phage Xula TaxID=2599884 RepID=A0A5J6TJW5_9CAUD|nr:hypothetical protein KNU73_gp70 [Mycobacterium phage Xula]QFG11141.1 hypothetical protein PBI_XULA_70 [Mycobacterium phage Xula]QFG15075.1 hypothetical protein PBI_QUEENHAZEL_69 [Mycobacterium phage QueenHazel]